MLNEVLAWLLWPAQLLLGIFIGFVMAVGTIAYVVTVVWKRTPMRRVVRDRGRALCGTADQVCGKHTWRDRASGRPSRLASKPQPLT